MHSASVCTRHGDDLRIVNSGNELWKWLCSIMGPARDDDDDVERQGDFPQKRSSDREAPPADHGSSSGHL